MSNVRRERKQAREEVTQPPKKFHLPARKVGMGLVIVAAFAVAYYLGYYKRMHRYDGFARCLTQRQLKMYGAFWCPHCSDQKELFGDSFEYAPYIECGVKGNTRQETSACSDAGIKNFPTWQFPPTGERVERVFSLEELSERSGCPLP